ncbi:unnamed protein product [Durusdinium trenchii]|uniref:Uncharacterized protein n=1 Tax=Durusdinium trenchii TaxID=1381693 RepID=A0ABP0NUZ4_9DINO
MVGALGGMAEQSDDPAERSPSTDPEMPPLVPVEPKLEPAASNAQASAKLAQLNFLATLGRARGGGAGRARGRGRRAKVEPESRPSPPIFVGPGATAPGASPQTVDFSRRAGDLAAMLDQLPAPSLDASAEVQPPKKPRRCFDNALEEIEVSAEASARAAADLQEDQRVDFLNAAESDSDSAAIDEDDEEERPGSTPTAPKQRHLVRELPPGAPNAQSACEEVLHAVASAGEGAVPPLPGGSSFGPRFKNLSKSELQAARQKWQLHTLAGVETSSSEQNRRAAEELFAALRRRAKSPCSADTSMTAADAAVAAAPKPVFRKRSSVPEESSRTSARPDAFTTPGTRILEECVAGRGTRRKADPTAVPPAVERAASKRRKGVCIADQE